MLYFYVYKGMSRPEYGYVMVESFPGNGLVAHLVAVGIHRVDGIMEYLGYPRAFVDAEFHEGVDAQFRCENIIALYHNRFLGSQQGIYVAHKCRIYVEESDVEDFMNIVVVLVGKAARINKLLEFGALARG